MVNFRMLLPAILSAGLLSAAAQPISHSAAYRFLQQSSWGPNAASIAKVQQVGFAAYLEEQVNAPESPITDVVLDAKGNGSITPVRQQFFFNAVNGPDQLRQRMAFALSQIWVISTNKINAPNAVTTYQRILQKDAFANYRTLMQDATLSAAMGHYLDMVGNLKPDPKTGRGADENYAREIMQLFTLGLNQLTGSAKGQPTYDQDTIEGFARAFTGWHYGATGTGEWLVPMVPVERDHDTDAKQLLTFAGVKHTMPANRSALEDLNGALDNIFEHPNMGLFIGRQLIQHLVTSAPSEAYVNRVAAVFDGTAKNKRGDLKAVVEAILLDTEARAGDDKAPAAGEGHLMEPALAMAQLLRETGATVAAVNNLPNVSAGLSQDIFDPPTVFNFYAPQYDLPGKPAVNAPEFQILSTANSVTRANVTNDLLYNRVAGVKVALSAYETLAAPALLDKLSLDLMGGRMPVGMQKPITDYMALQKTAHDKVLAAVYLITSSWQWQVQQ